MITPTITSISNMEAISDWVQPSNVGNSGGGSASQPAGTFVMTPGSPAIFSAKPAAAYNNGYWYRNIPGNWNAMTYFEYRLRFMLPTVQDIAACQAIEFELQQNIGSRIYNMAWQRRADSWYTFNYGATAWEPAGIPAGQLVGGQWVSVMASFLRGGDETMTHVALDVDGVHHPVNVTREATARVEGDYVHAAFQLDGNAAAMGYECEVVDVGVVMMATS